MPKLDAYRYDPSKETEGVWVDFEVGIQFKIARMNNPNFEQYMMEQLEPFMSGGTRRRKQGLRKASDPDLIREAVAYTVVLDWRNIEDADGNPVPYSKEKSLEILTEYQIIYDFVRDVAMDEKMFQMQAAQDAEGNSERSSAGQPDGASTETT